MGITKTADYTDHQNRIAVLAKALGHPARVAIVEYLLEADRCICGDLVGRLPLAQPTVSQHLRELKTAGLIQGTVEGTSICYCINPAVLQELSSFLGQVRSGCQCGC
ncbi:MAG: metalloregulator ArsR/SmtB family transcription factor [Balneolaceae bacterium]